MKRLVFAGLTAIAALLALSGCATLADKMGIANKAYADAQAAAAEERANTAAREALDTELARIQGELDAVRQEAGEMRGAMDAVNEVVASMTQVQEVARELEARLDALPEEMLRRLVDILSAYLEED